MNCINVIDRGLHIAPYIYLILYRIEKKTFGIAEPIVIKNSYSMYQLRAGGKELVFLYRVMNAASVSPGYQFPRAPVFAGQGPLIIFVLLVRLPGCSF